MIEFLAAFVLSSLILAGSSETASSEDANKISAVELSPKVQQDQKIETSEEFATTSSL